MAPSARRAQAEVFRKALQTQRARALDVATRTLWPAQKIRRLGPQGSLGRRAMRHRCRWDTAKCRRTKPDRLAWVSPESATRLPDPFIGCGRS